MGRRLATGSVNLPALVFSRRFCSPPLPLTAAGVEVGMEEMGERWEWAMGGSDRTVGVLVRSNMGDVFANRARLHRNPEAYRFEEFENAADALH